jgi:SAM-dependent methyltransferase
VAAHTYSYKASPHSSHSKVLERFPEPGNGKTVLDLGCGNGFLASILVRRGYAVTGLEQRGGYDEAFPSSVRLIEADLEQPLPALEPYDFILAADILEHLRFPEKLLEQLPRVLKPGGVLIGSLPNSGNLYFRLVVLSGRFPQDEKGLFDRTHFRFYTWDGWRNLLEQAGFQIRDASVTALPVSLVLPDSLLVRMAETVCYHAARFWATMFAYQFVVAALPGRSHARKS